MRSVQARTRQPQQCVLQVLLEFIAAALSAASDLTIPLSMFVGEGIRRDAKLIGYGFASAYTLELQDQLKPN